MVMDTFLVAFQFQLYLSWGTWMNKAFWKVLRIDNIASPWKESIPIYVFPLCIGT